jgi:hypothetical protein
VTQHPFKRFLIERRDVVGADSGSTDFRRFQEVRQLGGSVTIAMSSLLLLVAGCGRVASAEDTGAKAIANAISDAQKTEEDLGRAKQRQAEIVRKGYVPLNKDLTPYARWSADERARWDAQEKARSGKPDLTAQATAAKDVAERTEMVVASWRATANIMERHHRDRRDADRAGEKWAREVVKAWSEAAKADEAASDWIEAQHKEDGRSSTWTEIAADWRAQAIRARQQSQKWAKELPSNPVSPGGTERRPESSVKVRGPCPPGYPYHCGTHCCDSSHPICKSNGTCGGRGGSYTLSVPSYTP